MRKVIFFALVAVMGANPLFAQQESWISMGFEFGNSFEYTDGGNTYIGAPGFNISGYSFYDKKDAGFFFHYSFLFPVLINGDGSIYDYDLQWEFIIGPGFRYNFNENLKLQFGIGIDWMFIFASYNQNILGNLTYFAKDASNFGIGADIGIKYDITDYFYINAGLTVSYMFYNYTSISSSYSPTNYETILTQIFDGNIKGYGMLGIKPYICIGFNNYSEKAVWGKPKN